MENGTEGRGDNLYARTITIILRLCNKEWLHQQMLQRGILSLLVNCSNQKLVNRVVLMLIILKRY